MKIGIDITQAQYYATGVGNYTYNLVQNLLKLDKRNSYLLFGASLRDHKNLKKLAQSLSTHSKIFPFPVSLQEFFFNRLHYPPLELLTGKLDLVHTSDWTQPATRSKSITTIHDLTVLRFPSHQHPKIVSNHKKRLHWVAKEASSIITDSKSTKNDLINLLGIQEHRITPIYLAASDDFVKFQAQSSHKKATNLAQVKQKYSLNPNFFLSVGTNEPRKNLARTIQAFQLYNKKQPNPVQLVIVGKYGWGQDQTHTTDPNIKVLGFVDQQDLPAIYAAAKVFIYASLYEGFGFPVLEAMTIGTPVVTTKRGSLAEIAGNATILVDPESVTNMANGFHRALATSAELTTKGLKQAKNFSWKKTAQQTLAVYEKTFASS